MSRLHDTARVSIELSDEMVEKLVEAMDRDGDGDIDYREFTKQL